MTICNTFIRKMGNKAIIITVTDWADFKELELHSKAEDPDFLVSSTITKSIYSNMQPSMQINCYKPQDITEGTRGMGIAGITTQGCEGFKDESKNGPIWAFKKVGESITEHLSK